MKTFVTCFLLFCTLGAWCQKLPHGTVFGHKPDTARLIRADKLDSIMGKRTRVNFTVSGRVLLVTKQKGGWFNVDAGKGKIIAARFAQAGITLPRELKGRYIIMEGIAQRRFTPLAKRQDSSVADTKQALLFEVKGLMVDK